MCFEDELDVLIELRGQIDAMRTRDLQSRGAKVVSYCSGREYVQMNEAMIFSRRLTTICSSTRRMTRFG